jgi:hypothetical protein
VEFSGVLFTVPDELIPPSEELTEGYSIALYYMHTQDAATGTIIQIESDVAIELGFVSPEKLRLQVADLERNFTISDPPFEQSWEYFVLRFTNEADLGSPSRTTVAAFVNGDEVYNDTLDGEILHIISSISIGDGFSGFIEGIGIDTRLSSESDNTPRTDAIFLPQCLCPADSTLTAGEEFCSTPQETNQRYNSTAHTVEFLADSSLGTYWQSGVGDSPVAIVLGLNTPTSLSRIFIHFDSPMPPGITLQFLHDASSELRNLQYYADDCRARFGINDSVP